MTCTRFSALSILLATALPLLLSACKKTPIGHPPNTPDAPTGISNGGYNSPYEFAASAADPDTDSVAIHLMWGDGTSSEWSAWIASGDTVALSHSWSSPGTYQVKAQAKDKPGSTSDWSPAHSVVIVSTRAPNPPGMPTGPSETPKDSLCTFTTITSDPDGDGVSYRFDWGTGDTSDWTDWVPSGEPGAMRYAFRRAGAPRVRAQARDVNEVPSAWSNPYTVTVPNAGAPTEPTDVYFARLCSVGETTRFNARASDPAEDSVAIRIQLGGRRHVRLERTRTIWLSCPYDTRLARHRHLRSFCTG
jgi:hypothetical protein